MKKFIHIIHSDFSRNVGKNYEWFEYRLKIFKHFTIQSLVNQTNKDFYYVMYLRKCFPEKLLPKLTEILEESKLKYAIIYYDKENDIEKQITLNFPEAEYIYATRIDSDDLFHKDVVQEIQSYNFEWRRALIFQSGYLYNCVDNKMLYRIMNSPPFFTIMYPYNIYLNLQKSLEYKNTPSGHDGITSNMNSIILSNNKYIVLLHEQNNRSRSDKNNNDFIEEKQCNNILQDFGISCTTFNKIKNEKNKK